MAAKKHKETKDGQDKDRSSGFSIGRFVIIYLILMAAFFFIAWHKPIHRIIDINGFYTKLVVAATSKVLGIISLPCTFSGTVINLPSLSLDVKFGCNGLEAVMIYAIAVIAFPAKWKKKLLGIMAGLVIIQTANIIRIAFLAYSGVHMRKLFEFIHIYLAQGMMIALSLGLFFIYLNYAKNAKTAHN